MANIILSKESSEKQLKSYFEAVLKLSQTDNEFPINLDDVWMLAYAEKGKAVRALKANFIEGVDFCLAKMKSKTNSLSQNPKRGVFAQNGKNLFNEDSSLTESVEQSVSSQEPKNHPGGRPSEVFMLSIPCLEYFIARKVRPVFEVYRQVFHKVVTGKKEVIYTESEIKKLLTEADRLVSENINKSNRLEDLNKHLKSNFDAIKQLYQDELIYKCNIVAYLYSKGLYQEWEAHYNSLK